MFNNSKISPPLNEKAQTKSLYPYSRPLDFCYWVALLFQVVFSSQWLRHGSHLLTFDLNRTQKSQVLFSRWSNYGQTTCKEKHSIWNSRVSFMLCIPKDTGGHTLITEMHWTALKTKKKLKQSPKMSIRSFARHYERWSWISFSSIAVTYVTSPIQIFPQCPIFIQSFCGKPL